MVAASESFAPLHFFLLFGLAEVLNAWYVLQLFEQRGADQTCIGHLAWLFSLGKPQEATELAAYVFTFAFPASLLWDVAYLLTGIFAALGARRQQMLLLHLRLAAFALPLLPLLARTVDGPPNTAILLLRLFALYFIVPKSKLEKAGKGVKGQGLDESRELVHWWLNFICVGGFVGELLYSAVKVFTTCGNGLPLFGSASQLSFECFEQRRWYAVEFWVVCSVFSHYAIGLSSRKVFGPKVLTGIHVFLTINYIVELLYATFMLASICGLKLPDPNEKCYSKQLWYAAELVLACLCFFPYIVRLRTSGFCFFADYHPKPKAE